MRRPGVVFATKDGTRDPRLERAWKSAMAGRRERPLEHVWEQATARRSGMLLDVPHGADVVIDLTDDTMRATDGEPVVEVRDEAPSSDAPLVLPLPTVGEEPTETVPPAPEPALLTPQPIPGSEEQPGVDWVRGVDGNWYPPPEARHRPPPTVPPMPARRPRRAATALGAFGVIFIVLAIVAVIAGIVVTVRSYEDSTPVGRQAESNLKVGATARTGDIDVTLNAASDPYVPAGTADAAPSGQHLVMAELTLHNVSADANLNISSALLIDVTDAKGKAQSITVVTNLDPLDGPLLPGDTRHGFAVFRVADGSPTPLQLRVKGSLSAGGVTFTIP